ncbi:hypothetical protein TNCV_1581871 [Trichonephila clavipes]|nr:hypothetical protein TNCV_1581871 [Trichonephila clavipes]
MLRRNNDGIINLRKQSSSVKRKALADQRLGRSSGEEERNNIDVTERLSKFTLQVGTWSGVSAVHDMMDTLGEETTVLVVE